MELKTGCSYKVVDVVVCEGCSKMERCLSSISCFYHCSAARIPNGMGDVEGKPIKLNIIDCEVCASEEDCLRRGNKFSQCIASNVEYWAKRHNLDFKVVCGGELIPV